MKSIQYELTKVKKYYILGPKEIRLFFLNQNYWIYKPFNNLLKHFKITFSGFMILYNCNIKTVGNYMT